MFFDLISFFNRHYLQFSGETGQQLMLYIAFVQRFCYTHKIRLEAADPLEGLLPSLFKNVPGYAIKEAAVAFDAAIPWSLLQSNESLSDALQTLTIRLNHEDCATAEWFRQQTEFLLNHESNTVAATPASIRELIAQLAALNPPEEIVDICSGTYSLGFHVWNAMEFKQDILCFGEEINNYLCALSRLFLFLCGVPASSIFISKKNVMNVCEETDTVSAKYKIYLADFPLTGSRTIPVSSENLLIQNGEKSSLYADWFMMQKILQRMNDRDCAFFLVTKGALVRKNECFLRKYLIDQDWVDAVIHIPEGFYFSHNFPMELLICQKKRTARPCKKVLFANLHSLAVSNRQRRKALSPAGISEILKIFQQFSEKDGIAKVVAAEEIEKNDYSLFPPIYLADAKILEGKLRLSEVAEITRGLQNATPSKQGDRYLLNIRDIQDGVICYCDAVQINAEKAIWEKKYRIREDDIIITCKGATLKIAIVPPNPPPAYISGNLTLIRVNSEKYPPYLLYEYLNSDKGQHALELIQTGTTIRILGCKNLEQLAIPQYDINRVFAVGDSLKLAAIRYRHSMSDIEEEYKRKKENLLRQIEESEEI